LYLEVRVRCRRKMFTFAIPSPDEFFVYFDARNFRKG